MKRSHYPLNPLCHLAAIGYCFPDEAFLTREGAPNLFDGSMARPMATHLLHWLAQEEKFLKHLPDDRKDLFFKAVVIDQELRVNVYHAFGPEDVNECQLDTQPIFSSTWVSDGEFRWLVTPILHNHVGKRGFFSSKPKRTIEAQLINMPSTVKRYRPTEPFSSFKMRLDDNQLAMVRARMSATQVINGDVYDTAAA